MAFIATAAVVVVASALLAQAAPNAGRPLAPLASPLSIPEKFVADSDETGMTSSTEIGDIITYTLIVRGAEVGGDSSVAYVTDTLPADATLVDGSVITTTGSFTVAGGVLYWNGVIDAAQPATITFQMRLLDTLLPGQQITNTFVASNISTTEVAANVVTTTIQTPPMQSVIKWVNGAAENAAAPGEQITYTVLITSPGNSRTVFFSDVLPAGVIPISAGITSDVAPQPSLSGTLVTWQGMVSNAQPVWITMPVMLAFDLLPGAVITNAAQTSGLGGAADTRIVTTTVAAPALPELVKYVSDDAGGLAPENNAQSGAHITYTLALRSPLYSGLVTVTDSLPVSVTYVPGSATSNDALIPLPVVAGGVLTWSGVVSSAQPVTLTFAAIVTSPFLAPEIFTNTASLSGLGGLGSSNVVTTYAGLPMPASMSKQVSDADESGVTNSAPAGDTVTYTLLITSPGVSGMVNVTDVIPAGVTVVTYTSLPAGAMLESSPTRLVWSGPVFSAAPAVITIVATLDAGSAGASITNTASLTGQGGAGESNVVTTTVALPPPPAATKWVSDPNDNLVWENLARPGQTLTYTVLITPNGFDTVYFTDTMPVSTTLVGGSQSSSVNPQPTLCGVSVCWQGALLPTDTVVITFNVVIVSDVAEGTVITNEASVSGLSGSVAGNIVTTTIGLDLRYKSYLPIVMKPPQANIAAEKQVTPTYARPLNVPITYSVVFSADIGVGTAVMTDPVPAEASYVTNSARIVGGTGSVNYASGLDAITATVSMIGGQWVTVTWQVLYIAPSITDTYVVTNAAAVYTGTVPFLTNEVQTVVEPYRTYLPIVMNASVTATRRRPSGQ